MVDLRFRDGDAGSIVILQAGICAVAAFGCAAKGAKGRDHADKLLDDRAIGAKYIEAIQAVTKKTGQK